MCTMLCCVPGQDAAAADTGLGDAIGDTPQEVDQITAFLQSLNGVWLIGWIGDLNHFSWARFRSAQPGDWYGTVDILAGGDMALNAPYWPCSGQGEWMIPQKVNSVYITFPASCPDGIEPEYTFESFHGPGPYPGGAILAATMSTLGGTSLEGYKFPDSQCNAAMTSCSDPLQ